MHFLMALYQLHPIRCHSVTYVVVTSIDPFKAHLQTFLVCRWLHF